MILGRSWSELERSQLQAPRGGRLPRAPHEPGLHLKEWFLDGVFLCSSAVLWCAGEEVRQPSKAAMMSHVIRVVLCSDLLQHF